MNKNIEVIIDHNKLEREVYHFYLGNEYILWLDYYAFQKRLTSRHNFKNEKIYYRLEPRLSDLKENEVNLTEEIKLKVLNQLLSQIKIQKWSEKNER